ncbi:MAG TPA: ATP-binding protein [Candidatus Dormibacteraeota bacterium]
MPPVKGAAPQSLDDLRLRRDLVASLVLRTLAFADQLSGAALEARLGLPFETMQPLIEEFQRNQLMDTSGYSSEPGLEGRPIPVRMNYTVSSAGRQRASELAAVGTRYLGPCPVPFEDYMALVTSQVSDKNPVTLDALKRALGNLELEPNVVEQIGGAMVSRASLFIFGAPGNGKSTITERMALLMGAPIEVPFAVAVGDEIIRLVDPVYHRVAEGHQPADRRLLRVERPVVVAGGELKLPQLDLTYDATNRYYEAPLQWKANGGVLVIDDFGRQEVAPMRLLNRFIVPMEKKIDYLDLAASGRKIELPFLCQIVFSTNLSPSELVDEAFLRRMAYKIGIGNPSPEAYGRILRYECDRNGVPYDERAVGYLLTLYSNKPLRGSHPKQLVARLVDLAAFRGEAPRLTPSSIKEAFDACFNPALGGLDEEDWAKPATLSG